MQAVSIPSAHISVQPISITDFKKITVNELATSFVVSCEATYNLLTGLDDINTGCICAQVVGGDADVDSILVHLCDVEGEIATCRVIVEASVFLSHQYPGETDGRVTSGSAQQVNRLANHHWKHWLYSCPTGWI